MLLDKDTLIVVQIFAQSYPRYLIKIVNRHEEIYALLMIVVERYYLRKYSKFCTSGPNFSPHAGIPRCVIFRELLWP